MTTIYLAEIVCAINAAGDTTTLRYSTAGYNTKPSDTPANTHYEGRISQPALLQRDLFNNGKTWGRSSIGYGELVLINTDGALDYIADYGFDGRELTLKSGEIGAAYSTFVTVLSATMEQVDLDDRTATVRIKDKMLTLSLPICTTNYLGDNILPAGVEGVEDIKDKPKPRVFGAVYNIDPVLVNSSRLIYQVNNGAISTVSAVYDRGASLTQGADYTSKTDMETNAPAAAGYRVWPAGGYFRLGSALVGQITCDVLQGATSAARTPAQIISAIAGVLGVTAYAADVTALDAATSPQCGIYITDSMTALDAMDAVAASIGAWYGYDAAGNLRMGQLALPSGTPAAYMNSSTITSIKVVAAKDETKGIPAYRVSLSYAKNYVVQASDLAGVVTAERRAILKEAFRKAAAEDATIKLKYLNATLIERETLLVDKSAAEAEAARILLLLKSRLQTFELSVRAVDMSAVDLGKTVHVSHPRYGLSGGRLFRVLSMRTDIANNSVKLTLWG